MDYQYNHIKSQRIILVIALIFREIIRNNGNEGAIPHK